MEMIRASAGLCARPQAAPLHFRFALSGLPLETGRGRKLGYPLVDAPYFAGSLCYSIGSYLGVLETVKVARYLKFPPSMLSVILHVIQWTEVNTSNSK